MQDGEVVGSLEEDPLSFPAEINRHGAVVLGSAASDAQPPGASSQRCSPRPSLLALSDPDVLMHILAQRNESPFLLANGAQVSGQLLS